jgi:hypothetical protein
MELPDYKPTVPALQYPGAGPAQLHLPGKAYVFSDLENPWALYLM